VFVYRNGYAERNYPFKYLRSSELSDYYSDYNEN